MPFVSKSQPKLFGKVQDCKKGDKCSSEKVKDADKSVPNKDTKDLPEKVKKESFVDWFKNRELMNEEGTSTSDVASFARPIGASEPKRKCRCKDKCGCKDK